MEIEAIHHYVANSILDHGMRLTIAIALNDNNINNADDADNNYNETNATMVRILNLRRKLSNFVALTHGN